MPTHREIIIETAPYLAGDLEKVPLDAGLAGRKHLLDNPPTPRKAFSSRMQEGTRPYAALALRRSFDWSRTPQGHEFWDREYIVLLLEEG